MDFGTRPRLALVALAFLVFTATAHAQTAQITGTITDPSGAVVPGATLTIVNVDTKDTRVAASNDRGQYNAPFLPSGRYAVTCELSAFQTIRREGIVLETDQGVRVDFVLKPGALSESVTVVGTPVLAADTSSIGQVVTGQTISDLPLNGRNFLQLARLATGVLESAEGDRAAEGGAFVANGARSVLNSFMLDGVDNNARIVDQQNSSNVVSQPSVDALAEFSIQTNNFSAEYGQAAGAIVNATIRSGTNSFRGVAFEFVRNDRFDARNPFAASDEGKKLNRHQYGGTLGGPVRRDRTFFFASWETTDEVRGVDYPNTIPTAAQRAGDFTGFRNNQGRPVIIYDPATTKPNPNGSGVIRDPFPNGRIPADRIHPLSAKLLALLPDPRLPDLTRNYPVTRDAFRMRYQMDSRVDHSFSNSSKLYLRYSMTNRDDAIPGPYDAPLIGTTQFQQALKDQFSTNIAVGQTQVLGRNRVNELRIGYNRIRDDLFPWVKDTTPVGFGFKGIPEGRTTGLPRIAISGFSNLGEAAFLPNFKISEVTQAGDTFSFLRGRHGFKAGANYRFIRSFFDISAQARGFYNFTGAFSQDPQARASSGSGLADFLLGLPHVTQLSTTLRGDIRYHYLAGYLQDDWRVNPRLTLNLGVRYELFTHPYERDGSQGNLLLDDLKLIYAGNNVPPSVPAAFTKTVPEGVSSKTLMRLDTNNLAPRLGFAFKARDETVLRGGAGIFYGDHPTIGASGRLPANPPYQVNVTFTSDQITPLMTLDTGFPSNALEPVFSPLLTFNAWDPDARQATAYHWNASVQNEFRWFVVELGYTGSHGENLAVGYDPNAPVPGPGSVASRRPWPQFGGINSQRYDGNSDYHAGHLRVDRRLRNGVSVIGHYTFAKSIDVGGTNFISGDNVYRNPRDIELDRGLSSFDVRHNMVLSYIWDVPVGPGRRFQLPTAWLNGLLGGWQFNGITTARSGTPFTPRLNSNPTNSGHARPDRLADGNLPRGERSAERWFDSAAFAPPAQFVYGSAGRNILIGPGSFNTDFGLFKRFRFDGRTRRHEIQIRIEAFNVFNEPHYGQPNATIDLLDPGRITGIVGTMREMQLGIKYLF